DLVVLAMLGRVQLQAAGDAAGRQIRRRFLAKNWQEHRIPDEIAANGNAKQIVIALFDVRTDAGEIDTGRVDLSEKIGSAKDRLFGDVGAELQHQERGEVISGILDVAPDRDPKHVDRRARYVTQHELHERSDEGDISVNERSAN